MAVDIRDKRMSMIGLALPFLFVLPQPEGSIGAGDRFQLLWLYRAFQDAANFPPFLWIRRRRRR